MVSDTILESYITDNSAHSINVTGNLYAENITQVVKVDSANPEASLSHNYYTIDEYGVIKKMGGLSFFERDGVAGLSIQLSDSVSGETTSVFNIGPDGLTLSGGISVVGGSTVFETSSIAVSDFDITLGSGATSKSQLDGGGFTIGTPDSGEINFKYSYNDDYLGANTGVNVESGHAFTVNTNSVVLDESGLQIDNIVSLSQAGLQIGSEVSISSAGIEIGSVDPAISLGSEDGLLIGTETKLNESGLFFTNSSFTDSAITFNSEVDYVAVNSEGLQIGENLQITKTSGINFDNFTSLTSSCLTFGESPDETVIDGLSVKLGEDVLLNHDGLYVTNPDAAIYLGGTKWKISFDATTENLKFQYFDDSSYVTKMELKSSSSLN